MDASAVVDPRVIHSIQTRGSAGYWVILRDRADLSAAASIRSWDDRGAFVVNQLMDTARESQRRVRTALDARGVRYRAFWALNAIRVQESGWSPLRAIAAFPEVQGILPTWHGTVGATAVGSTSVRPDTVEWNVQAIRAPKVWKRFGDRGDGIVVATIDTGVQFDHPALVRQYRGNNGDGTFDHNYNWFDPAKACPQKAPCDNVAHGTHLTGTAVGDDGDPGMNQIGVAPHARWIAAKGCEDFSCSDTSLVAAGQWMLAPTNLNGKKPRPGGRPDVIENAWGTDGSNDFYRPIVRAWVAAGIFPVFSGGAEGPSCGTIGAPASFPESYGVGAFDRNDAVASFSSRGPSPFGVTKPDLAAPGVDIRSSVPGNGYQSYGGTSMASAHVAGVVALMWASAPAIRGDVAATVSVLDGSALDRSDLRYGGDAGDNDVWGQGRLDALSAVRAARALDASN
jgi:subtilisin family serine protease